ncbi:C40 family peptidase [Amnibacterium kyonggiense]|uniref:Cell wall-associated NlpC family hydrolase n=1 Tax=Amnibacterium kyonggiense TaxID=595671 RepID=A0A4R7FIN9_9MICO|nr:C40 family peptidase [Amnibacterium kyonggiense]TDS76151.1 cell wall-associated NlpC family hydrolase [Amnibacterium kyonggiense]
MHFRARNIAGLAITATVAGVIAASGLTTASAADLACSDISKLSGKSLSSCITTLRSQAEAAGRTAAKADEAYLEAKHKAADAKATAVKLDRAAEDAALVAQRSTARAAATAAQLARTGGSVGQTTQVLLSGDGASSVLYHLSRMSELTSDTTQIADQAKQDRAQADDLRTQAKLAADGLAADEQDAKQLYDQAKKAASAATLLVAKAEEKRSPGTSAAFASAYKDLPSDASVAETVIAFARAQIGKPYVFGAAGPGSFDCSGLTMAAFAATGRQIGGHGVNVQYRLAQSKGLLVPYSAAKPGDLLFYGSGDFYHVALYSGGGNMIEAPYPGRDVREVPVRTAGLAPVVARFTG